MALVQGHHPPKVTDENDNPVANEQDSTPQQQLLVANEQNGIPQQQLPVDNEQESIPQQQLYTINQILNATGAESWALEYNHTNDRELDKFVKDTGLLLHPDKVPPDLKEKATQATQRLFDFRDELRRRPGLATIAGTSGEELQPFHKELWAKPDLKTAILGLQLKPADPDLIFGIDAANKEIEAKNRNEHWQPQCGKFTPFFLNSYAHALNFRLEWFKADLGGEDEKTKDAIKQKYDELFRKVEGFCDDGKYPKEWKIPPDIQKKIPGNAAVLAVTKKFRQQRQQPFSESPPGPGEISSSGQPANTNRQPEQPPNLSQPADINLQPGITSQPGQPPFQAQEANRDVQMGGTGALTIRDQPILAKRQHLRDKQYLIVRTEPDGTKIHEWVSSSICAGMNSEYVPAIAEYDKPWIMARKGKYQGIEWLALKMDDSIIPGVGRYPPITFMVAWTDGTPSCLMWRSDLIKVIGRQRVEQDMRALLLSQVVELDGKPYRILSPTESGLQAGYYKARHLLLDQDLTRTKGIAAPPSRLLLENSPSQNSAGSALVYMGQPVAPSQHSQSAGNYGALQPFPAQYIQPAGYQGAPQGPAQYGQLARYHGAPQFPAQYSQSAGYNGAPQVPAQYSRSIGYHGFSQSPAQSGAQEGQLSVLPSTSGPTFAQRSIHTPKSGLQGSVGTLMNVPSLPGPSALPSDPSATRFGSQPELSQRAATPDSTGQMTTTTMSNEQSQINELKQMMEQLTLTVQQALVPARGP